MTRETVVGRIVRCLIMGFGLALSIRDGATTLQAGPTAPKVPVSVVWTAPDRLVVALRDDRSLVMVDPETHQIGRRIPLEFRPHSLTISRDGLLLIGGVDGEAEVREPDGSRPNRLLTGRGPTRLVSLDPNRLAAVSLWDRRVVILNLRSGEKLATHSLPFEPGVMLPLPGGRLLVADAFGGQFVTLMPGEEDSASLGRVDAVNIRGLALSGDGSEVLLTHMASSGPTQVTRTNVDWGLILSSKLTSIRVTALTESRPSYRQLSLDGSGNGSADPSGIAVSPDGNVIYVSLGGAHKVLRIDRRLGGPTGPDLHPLGDSNRLEEAAVGRSPFAISLDPEGTRLATADAMSDSVTILSASDLKPLATIALNEEGLERTSAQRGEALFLDGRRALDRWMSCASCHPGGHTVSLRFDTLGDGTYGNPKDTPSLLGVVQTPPFGWTGRFRRLENQVEQSMLTSLHGPHPNAEEVADVVSYLSTLEPPPPLQEEADEIASQGRILFQTRNCDECHQPPTFSSRPLRNPSLSGVEGTYSAPSLLGVGRTAPYFHDASAETLEDVLDRHHPGFDSAPSADQRAALSAYLRTLGTTP